METHHHNQSSSSSNRPSPLSTAALTAAPPQPPSFNSYSSEHLADIAARVVSELNLSPNTDPYDDDFYSHLPLPKEAPESEGASYTVDDESEHHSDEDDEDDESEFEFVVLCRDQDLSSPISADEIFDNGHIKPMYPIFNTDLVYGPQIDAVSDRPATIRLPLRKLMRQDRENGTENGGGGGASCSSSSEEAEAEAEALEGVPPGTYCVWAPKKKSENDDALMRKKSNSTGSQSKRWRFRDLLHRSNSDGKETFVFLTPSHHHHLHHHGGGSGGGGGELRRREKMAAVEPKKRRSSGLEGKKKSYLPYRRDLVGFFASANGISRTVRPF